MERKVKFLEDSVENKEDQIYTLKQELKSTGMMIGFRATAVGNANSGTSIGNRNPGEILLSYFLLYTERKSVRKPQNQWKNRTTCGNGF